MKLLVEIVASCWLHDVIEDCRVNYNDLKAEFDANVADIVYNVTNELGKNRAERAEKTYPKIASDKRSLFVKCCDRLANMQHSAENGTMRSAYIKEHEDFMTKLKVRETLPTIGQALDEAYEQLIKETL